MAANYTLKVNIRAQEERERREKDKDNLIKILSAAPTSRPRKRRGLQFNEPGKYIQEAEKLRKRARLEELQRKIAASSAKTGVSDVVKLKTLTNKLVPDEEAEHVPDIDWWDKVILEETTLEDALLKINQGTKPECIFKQITNLIEHPSVDIVKNEAVEEPVFLTKAEAKKLARQTKKAAELEKQEQIKLGLLPKPETKLKRSNIIFTMGQEAIVNPSKVELMVKEQEEKRLEAHAEHNAAGKLSKDERKEKKIIKFKEDAISNGIHVSVYRIDDISFPSHKFKVVKNANQLALTGILAMFKDFNVVVTEGGPKQQRKYQHLLLDRIKWNEDIQQITDKSKPVKNDNKCVLIWNGLITERSFRVFRVKTIQTEAEGRQLFAKFNVQHYWDLAHKMNILETIN